VFFDGAPSGTGMTDTATRIGEAVALGAITSLVTRDAAAAGGRLLVFVHTAVKQRALQSALQEGLAGVTVTAVGRIADVERALNEGQDAVLTLPIVLAARGLALRLQGIRGGAADEGYALVGVGRAPDPASVASVGALDLLGREGTNAFVADLVGRATKVERVTKVEDLLPLLQMSVVESVLLATRLLPDVRAASQLSLIATELPKRVLLPAVASLGPAADAVVDGVRRMPANAMALLGVDGWR
jgi:hypothetical protein